MEICCMVQETQTGALYQPRGVGWEGRWEGDSKRRGCIYTYGLSLTEKKKKNSVKQFILQ